MITQTSIDSFFEIIKNPVKLQANERIVLDVFQLYPTGLCNDEAAQLLGWEINRVTPRVNSLVKKGKLFALGCKVNIRTGRNSIVWADTKNFHVDFVAACNSKTKALSCGVTPYSSRPKISKTIPESYPQDNNNIEDKDIGGLIRDGCN
jgi:hypothetical protein